jgi:PKD repeat protein
MEVAVTIRMMCRAGLAALVVLSLAGCADDATGPDGLAPDSGLYAKGDGGNGGGGGGGGSGGGGGKGELYSELVVLYRAVNGVPIVIGPFVGEHGTEYCVQPVTPDPQVPNPCFGDEHYEYEGGGCPYETQYLPTMVNPVTGETVTLVPLFAHFPGYLPPADDDPHTHDISPSHTVDEGGEPCDPLVIKLDDGTTVNYAVYATEADLERLNLGRTQPGVLEQHLEETILMINSADVVTLDPAGRFAFEGESYDGDPALDAGPKLQAVRQELLETGTLPRLDDPYPTPFQLLHVNFAEWDTWELSAFALGGAASKFGTINVDIVAYHDRVLNIANDWQASGFWPKVTHHSTELNESFVDYSAVDYNRGTTFPGCVVYLDPADWQAGYKAARLLNVVQFTDLGPNRTNIAGYAQMAEDARSVIYFIHLYDSVIDYADPVGMDSWAYCVNRAAELNEGSGGGGGEDPPPPPTIDPPVASFTYECSNTATCRFTDTSTGESISLWSWVFQNGDPAISLAQNPATTFQTVGNHDVALTVANAGGSSETVHQTVSCSMAGKLRCK